MHIFQFCAWSRSTLVQPALCVARKPMELFAVFHCRHAGWPHLDGVEQVVKIRSASLGEALTGFMKALHLRATKRNPSYKVVGMIFYKWWPMMDFSRDSQKYFSRGEKVAKFNFTHSKLLNGLICWTFSRKMSHFKIQGSRSLSAIPSDAHAAVHLVRKCPSAGLFLYI